MKGVRVERERATLHVQLNSPQTGNALDENILDELIDALSGEQDNTDIRVIVLSGAGDDFCVGGSVAELANLAQAERTGTAIRRIEDKTRRVYEALSRAEAVTLARLQGRTIGAGLGLALCCDLRVGDEGSRFRLPETALGLPAAWGGALARLIGEIGPARARAMILTGRTVDADSAYQMALLHHVAPAGQLDDVIREWTAPMCRWPSTALRTNKRLLRAYSTPNPLADITLFDSYLMANAVSAQTRLGRLTNSSG